MLDNLKQFKISRESLVAVLGGNKIKKCKGKQGNDKRKCEEGSYSSSGVNSTGGDGGNSGGNN